MGKVRLLRPLLLPLLAAGCAEAVYDPVLKAESARLFGNIDATGYYYVDLLVGTPPQRVSVILDTGSSTCAFPCTRCRHCGEHLDPAFNFSRSSSASWVPCGKGCGGGGGGCQDERCTYSQGYLEGSGIHGHWFEDLVRLGDVGQHNPAVRAEMGCHSRENRLFYTQRANGILGIGVSVGSDHTLLDQLFVDHPHVNSSIFAVCLAEWGGSLVVGGYNASHHRGPMQRVPLGLEGSYAVPLSAVDVDGRVVSEFSRPATVDSGSTRTYMASGPYQALRSAIEAHCRRRNNCGAERSHSGECWRPGALGLRRFPTVGMHFQEGVRTEWVPKAYLYRRGRHLWCYAFEDDGPIADTVLGATWMMHQDVVFDVQHGELGIAPAQCPEVRKRPEPPGSSKQFFSEVAVEEHSAAVADWRASPIAPTLRDAGFLVLGLGLGLMAMGVRVRSSTHISRTEQALPLDVEKDTDSFE